MPKSKKNHTEFFFQINVHSQNLAKKRNPKTPTCYPLNLYIPKGFWQYVSYFKTSERHVVVALEIFLSRSIFKLKVEFVNGIHWNLQHKIVSIFQKP